MIRPEVLPEEFALGYKGRVMAFNGMTDPKLAMDALMEWSGNAGTSRRNFSTVELLAAVAEVDVAQFVRAHTALPLRRAVVAAFRVFSMGARANGRCCGRWRCARPGLGPTSVPNVSRRI